VDSGQQRLDLQVSEVEGWRTWRARWAGAGSGPGTSPSRPLSCGEEADAFVISEDKAAGPLPSVAGGWPDCALGWIGARKLGYGHLGSQDGHGMNAETVPEKHSDDAFSPYVQEHVGWYVYLLRDPRDDVIFYVGKGKGNRVFAHAQAALAIEDDDEASLKLTRIREIRRAGLKVQTEIIRHRISSEAAAYAVEAAVLDTFRALRQPLTNVVLGHQHELNGWASTSTVASLYDAPPLPNITDPVVLLKIPKLWTPAMSAAALFEVTRGWWTVGPRALGARYALSVNRGVTRAAYHIEYWRERAPTDRDYSVNDKGKRLGFWGKEAPELSHLVNRSISHLPQSSGGSFIYLNLDPNAVPLTPLYRGAEARAKAAEEKQF
jgi:uncharacterized protein